MARIVFATWPAFGHLNPTLKIARKLQKSGHRVCYLGLPSLEQYVITQGLEFFTVLSEVGDFDSLLRAKISNPVEEFRQVLATIQPDLLIVDELLRDLAVAARKIGIPTVLIAPVLTQKPLNLDNEKSGDSAFDLPLVVLCPAEFDLPAMTEQESRYYVEASIDLERREMHPFPWDKLNRSKPLIYCSLGSHSNHYERSQKILHDIIEAVGQRPEWQLVLATGTHPVAPICQRIPENALIVEWAPQLEILKCTSIMINHGGLGAVKECIYFGVPMIVIPMMWDQMDNAARVVHHGMGLRGDPDLITSQQINSFIDHLQCDASVKTRVALMSKVFREAEERGRSTQIIESLIPKSYSNGKH